MIFCPTFPTRVTELSSTDTGQVVTASIPLNNCPALTFPEVKILFQEENLELITFSLMFLKKALTTESPVTAITKHHFLFVFLLDDDSFTILGRTHLHVRIFMNLMPLLYFLV